MPATSTKGKSTVIRLRSPLPVLTCENCTLNTVKLLHPKMPPTGALRPVFYFLGMAPGKTEDEKGVQFTGESGTVVRNRIPSKHLSSIRWNNVVRCRSSVDNLGRENRDPTPHEVACCRRLQLADIQTSKPEVIVGFGSFPLSWLLGPSKDGGDKKITDWRGRRMPVRVGTHTCWFYPLNHPASLLYARKENNLEQTFTHDLKRVFQDYEDGLPVPDVEEPANYYKGIQTTPTDFSTVINQLEEAAKLKHSTIDLETSRLRPYFNDAKILTCAVGTYESTIAFPIEHPEAKWTPSQLKKIYSALEAYLLSSGHKCAHYAKFEQEWLCHVYGPKVVHQVHWEDTGAMAHALDGRSGKALENLTEMYFGFNVKKLSKVDTKAIAAEPLEKVLLYNALDTKYTDALCRLLLSELQEQGLTHVYERINSVTPSFTMMQAVGVHRNVPVIEQFSKELGERKVAVVDEIMNNQDIKKFIVINGKFKPTSNPDLQKFFKDYLKYPHPHQHKHNYKYSLAEEILEQMKHPIAKKILEMRTTAGNLKKYIEPLLALPSPEFPTGGRYVCGDGMLHASFTQLIAGTGRASCEDPPLQQWPKREHREIRRGIAAPPNHYMVSFDYGQLEARVIAMLSRCPVLCAEISKEYDIHGDWTDMLGKAFNPSMIATPAARHHLRDYIKNKWTFPLFFGSVLESVTNDLSSVFERKIYKEKLEPFYNRFWQKYRAVLGWQNRLKTFYRRHHYVETALGFRRRGPLSDNELINAPVQGTAAQLVQDAQKRISKLAYEINPQYQPVLNMHDDLTFYLDEKTVEQDIEFLAREMCVFSHFDFVTVPLSVEVQLGRNWADQELIGTFTSTDFGWKPPKGIIIAGTTT